MTGNKISSESLHERRINVCVCFSDDPGLETMYHESWHRDSELNFMEVCVCTCVCVCTFVCVCVYVHDYMYVFVCMCVCVHVGGECMCVRVCVYIYV